MSRTLNLNNTENIICDTIHLIKDNKLIDIIDLFLSKSDASDIVGLPPDTLNTLQEIANSIGNDADFFNTITTQISQKRNITDSYDKTYINDLISLYYTKTEINTNLEMKLDKSVIDSYYDKIIIDMLLDNYYNKTDLNDRLSLKASLVAVSDLSIEINTKASQSSLTETNNSLNIAYNNISALGESINNGYTTLSQSLNLKA
jgi:hypothetical protein